MRAAPFGLPWWRVISRAWMAGVMSFAAIRLFSRLEWDFTYGMLFLLKMYLCAILGSLIILVLFSSVELLAKGKRVP
jgi:hypothetical protein